MVSDEFFMRVMVNHARSASLLGRTFNGFAKKFNLLCLQGFFPIGIVEKQLVTIELNGNVMYWFCRASHWMLQRERALSSEMGLAGDYSGGIPRINPQGDKINSP